MGVDTGTESAWQENVGRGEITARNKQISRETAKTPGDVWEKLGCGCSGGNHTTPRAGVVLLVSFPSSRKYQGTGVQQGGGGKIAQGNLGELVHSPHSSRGIGMVGAPHPIHGEIPWRMEASPWWRGGHCSVGCHSCLPAGSGALKIVRTAFPSPPTPPQHTAPLPQTPPAASLHQAWAAFPLPASR